MGCNVPGILATRRLPQILVMGTIGAVIGAVLGVGIVKGISTVSGRTLVNILIAWLLTPAVAGFFATALDFTIHLQYVPNP